MTILLFLVVLSVLVLAHEFGHYIAARIFGVRAEEFGFGFPPRLLGFVKDRGRFRRIGPRERGPFPGTIWSVNWLPLGGFVRLKGEALDGVEGPDSFHTKPVWQRLVVLAAGVTMNWILATVLFFIVFSVGSTAYIQEGAPPSATVRDRQVVIGVVADPSPARAAGLLSGDAVLSIGGVSPTSSAHAQALIADTQGGVFDLAVESGGGTRRSVRIASEYLPEYEKMAVGISLFDTGIVSFPPLAAASMSVQSVWFYSKTVLLTFGDIIRSLIVRAPIAEGLAGPVGIAVITGRVAERGIVPLMEFMAILSVNLAILNILPIPALDGGRVLFLGIEKLRRKPMSRAVEGVIHNIAFFILIGLVLIITAADISRLSSL